MRILLVTPPFTQLNTPYPATAYLKGYMSSRGHEVAQLDLGIETFHRIYSPDFLAPLFTQAAANTALLSANPALERMTSLADEYLKAVAVSTEYLRGLNPEWTQALCYGSIIPHGHRFDSEAETISDIETLFGLYGLADTARYAATLNIEEVADFLHWTVSVHYQFSRYAPSLAMSPPDFDDLYQELNSPFNVIEKEMTDILGEKIRSFDPDFLGITIPFPGNLFSALRCGGFVRKEFGLDVIMGGGYVSTELRQLSDPRFFDFCDYLCLDDGELPLARIVENGNLIRTMTLTQTSKKRDKPEVCIHGRDSAENIPHKELPPPDYSGLDFTRYLAVLDNPSPMHRLWSEHSWIKYTLAHGCYWKKCTFCDTSLDYIARFEPRNADRIADDMEQLSRATGLHGFHFVDEAAPPALLSRLSLEIIRRGLSVVWWTNIRFERNFTPGLARLMARAGCVGVAGGIETAHPRLLSLINKGVELDELICVLDSFRQAGILAHAYLMYAFPTQTLQETVDSCEIVRQLFVHGLVSSVFWHRFGLSAHSPVGHNPGAFGIRISEPDFSGFARNALCYETLEGPLPAWIPRVGAGLEKSASEYMRGRGTDKPPAYWFEGDVPCTRIEPSCVEAALAKKKDTGPVPEKLDLVWLSPPPRLLSGKKKLYRFHTPEHTVDIAVPGHLSASVEVLFSSRGHKIRGSDIPDIHALIASPFYAQLKEIGLIELYR